MNTLEPYIARDSFVQDTPPYDGLTITWRPSEYDDSTASAHQWMDAMSAQAFMQEQWRSSAEQQLDRGMIASGYC